GQAVRGVQPGRCHDRSALRRNGARTCPLAQARAHDGRRCDRDERAWQRLGVHRAPAGGREHVNTPEREGSNETSPQKFSASGRGRCRASGRLADRRRVASPTAIASFKKSAYSEIFVCGCNTFTPMEVKLLFDILRNATQV